jgi:putative transposase
MKLKKWSKEEKLKILEEAAQGEVIETCRKYEVSTATYYSWKRKFDTYGASGLSGSPGKSNSDSKRLKDENRRLRKLLIDHELDIEAQKELLKKSLGPTIQERSSGPAACQAQGKQKTFAQDGGPFGKQLLLQA